MGIRPDQCACVCIHRLIRRARRAARDLDRFRWLELALFCNFPPPLAEFYFDQLVLRHGSLYQAGGGIDLCRTGLTEVLRMEFAGESDFAVEAFGLDAAEFG